MKQKLIFLLLRFIVTVAVMLLSFGYTAIYQVLIDCSKGDIGGALFLIVTMGLVAWFGSGAVIDEMRTSQGVKGRDDTYDN